jgi:hypothetical protein
MISRKHPAGFRALLIAIGMLLLLACPVFAQETGVSVEAADPDHYINAYYFHGSKRCGPCIRIEEWAEEAILTAYQEKLRSSALQWHVINVSEPANEHFIKDYQIYTQTVILAEFRDGQQVRWKNLDQVWKLLRNKEKFIEYVRTEIDDWVKVL